MILAIQLLSIILSVLALGLSLISLVLTLAAKNSTHKIQMISPETLVSDEQLEAQLRKVPELSPDQEPPSVTEFDSFKDYAAFSQEPQKQPVRQKFPTV